MCVYTSFGWFCVNSGFIWTILNSCQLRDYGRVWIRPLTFARREEKGNFPLFLEAKKKLYTTMGVAWHVARVAFSRDERVETGVTRVNWLLWWRLQSFSLANHPLVQVGQRTKADENKANGWLQVWKFCPFIYQLTDQNLFEEIKLTIIWSLDFFD